MTPARTLASTALVLAVAAGCGSASSGGVATVSGAGSTGGASASPSPSPSPSSTATDAAGCTSAVAHPRTPQQFASEPPLTTARTTYTATVVTNCGTIVVALDGAKAPHTVNSFAFLAAKHWFDGTPCHRLTTSTIFVLQCGDPTGTGRGGPGYTIPDEDLSGATYPAGTVAMANSGQPHTGGSQFFFVYADTPLPPSYTPFGRVTSGLDVLKRIAAAGTDDSNASGDGAPRQPVTIESFTVTKGAPA